MADSLKFRFLALAAITTRLVVLTAGDLLALRLVPYDRSVIRRITATNDLRILQRYLGGPVEYEAPGGALSFIPASRHFEYEGKFSLRAFPDSSGGFSFLDINTEGGTVRIYEERHMKLILPGVPEFTVREDGQILWERKKSKKFFGKKSNLDLLSQLPEPLDQLLFFRYLRELRSSPLEPQSVVELVNRLREDAGLRPVVLSKKLTKAARSHAAYLYYHQGSGHDEVPGKKYFLKKTSRERISHFVPGYPGTGEVIAYRETYPGAVISWIYSLYHRVSFFRSDLRALGVAAEFSGNARKRSAVVVTMGYLREESPSFIPFPGAGSEFPVSWEGNESPDPSPGKARPLGFPVTLSFNRRAREIFGALNSHVRVTLRMGRINKSAVLGYTGFEHFQESFAGFIPTSPLEAGDYVAAVEFPPGFESLNFSWSFRTWDISLPLMPEELGFPDE